MKDTDKKELESNYSEYRDAGISLAAEFYETSGFQICTDILNDTDEHVRLAEFAYMRGVFAERNRSNPIKN